VDDRTDARIDRELRSLFAGSPPPNLPLDFTRTLRRQVVGQRRQLRAQRCRLLVMRAYWGVAALASALLLARLQLPSDALEGPWSVVVMAMLTLGAAPAVLLLRGLGMNVLDLLTGTVRGLEAGHRMTE
jgi:hypothetical protein